MTRGAIFFALQESVFKGSIPFSQFQSLQNQTMTNDLWQQTQAQWQKWHNKRLMIALSGGLDSVVLLHLACRARDELGIDIAATHIHHGLQNQADQWAKFCADLTKKWHIPFTCIRVQINPKGLGLEAAARQARYHALQQCDADVLLTAHHQNDQIETLLLGILRGGGARALSAMPEHGVLGEKMLLRPLLMFSRETLMNYAQQHQLKWIDDPSNSDTRLLRNWIRHQWLPDLLQHLPHAKQQLTASIAAAQEDLCLIDEVAKSDWLDVHHQGRFDLRIWQKLTPARRRLLLREFAVRHHLGVPRQIALKAWESQLSKLPEKTAQWQLPHGKAFSHRHILFALPQTFAWETKALKAAEHLENCPSQWQHGWIRKVKKDDVLHLNVGRKSIRSLLQQYGVAPIMRERWAVLEVDGQCVCLLNLRNADAFSHLAIAKLQALSGWAVDKDSS